MDIRFKWVGGATWVLWVDDIKIACDPVLCPKGTVQNYKYFKTKRLDEPVYTGDDFKDMDYWFLTHDHEDHIDEAGIEVIDPASSIIGHMQVMHHFKGRGFHHCKTLLWNETVYYRNKDYRITVKGVPAIHGWNPFFGRLVGDGNGYYITVSKGDECFTLYITGDSVFRPDVAGIVGKAPLDLVVANVGAAHVGDGLLSKIIGRITNCIDDVKKMTQVLRPRHVIPVHWGTFSHYTEGVDPSGWKHIHGAVLFKPGEEKYLG